MTFPRSPAFRQKRPCPLAQHVEIDWGPFERRIRIARPVDPSSASVTYERGLLQITLPLAQHPIVARVLIGVRIP